MEEQQTGSPFLVPLIISAIVFCIALLPMPYGFYTITRVIIFVISIYGAVLLQERHTGLFWAMVGLAILYNPIVPIHLYEKILWTIANVMTLGIFIWANLFLKAKIQ